MKRFLSVIFLLWYISVYAQNQIAVKATGKTSYKVSSIQVQVVVETIGHKLDSANTATYHKSLAIIKLLSKYGYSKNTILTLSSTNSPVLYPDSDEEKYQSHQSYRFLLNKIDFYDQLKKELIIAGAKDVSFTAHPPKDIDSLSQVAYKNAIDEANKKASFIAKSFDYKTIKMVKVIETEKDYRDIYWDVIEKVLFSDIYDVKIAESQKPLEPIITNLEGEIKVNLAVVYEFSN